MGLRGAGASFLKCCYPPGGEGGGGAAGTLSLPVRGGYGADAEPATMRTTLRAVGGEGEGEGALLHACVSEEVPPERAVAWAAALLDGAAPARVLVLEQRAKPLLRLPGGEQPEAPLLRALATDAFPAGELCAPPLAPPSVVDGAAAALLTACQARGVAAAAYVSALEPGSTLTMRAFEALLPAVAPGCSAADVGARFGEFAADIDTLSAQARESLYS